MHGLYEPNTSTQPNGSTRAQQNTTTQEYILSSAPNVDIRDVSQEFVLQRNTNTRIDNTVLNAARPNLPMFNTATLNANTIPAPLANARDHGRKDYTPTAQRN
jgi:hypothetical protein